MIDLNHLPVGSVPKKRKLWPKISLIMLVLLVVGAISSFWWYQNSLKAPSTDATQKVFIINVDESVSSIASRLQAEGLIKNSLAFRIYLQLSGTDKKIQSGDFKLRADMTASELAENLGSGVIDVWVTLLEGWRKEEIAQELNKKLGLNQTEFIAVAEEGYMFPDTYLLPKDASAADIVEILRNNFNKRLAEKNLTTAGGTRELTFAEKITLASILERESKDGPEEKSTIAGILMNRYRQGMALQADATVQYDLGTPSDWWPNLTQEDYQLKGEYSTYARPGLPPGPIASPGIDSIAAAFNPAQTEYLYYLHDRDGQVRYATTLDEHNANIAEYLR